MKARFVRLENYQLELHDIGTILRLRAGLHGGGGVVVAIEGIAEVSHLRNKLGFFLLLLLLLGVLSSLRYVDQTVYGIGRIVKEENKTRGRGAAIRTSKGFRLMFLYTGKMGGDEYMVESV